jgi:uncharacterized protein YodC (DUF2158 family)
MDTIPFKIGDVVQLKSGGSKMTVTSISEDQQTLSAIWFDGTKKAIEAFPFDVVISAQDQPISRPGRAFFQKSP